MDDAEPVSVDVAADMLGVRKATVYAYVSRGLLRRTYATDPDGRRVSRLELNQVREMAAHTHRPRAGRFELSIDSAVSELDAQGRLSYRGQDALDLAEHSAYETVAELLWEDSSTVWQSTAAQDDVCQRVLQAGPPDASPADRARIALSLLAAGSVASPTNHSRDNAVTAIITCSRALSPTDQPWQGDVATTAAMALCQEAPGLADVDLLRRALILLADHELATSTVAARAAAGTGASLLHCLLAGAAAHAGPLHGQASGSAESTLRRWLDTGEIDEAPGGFGHRVYAHADPRAEHLLDAVQASHPDLADTVDQLTLRVLQRDGTHPNIDLALAAMTVEIPLRSGSGEAIFLLARLAGMTAHVLEERDHPLRFRPRAIYTGEPGSGPT